MGLIPDGNPAQLAHQFTRGKEGNMFAALIRLLGVQSRKRAPDPKSEKRYRLTLNLKKVRPGASEADVNDWLLKMGLTPTGNPAIWKARESVMARVPKGAVMKSEKL